ncbi:MAG: hypothetical protein ACNI27_07740 [Desulfovibrio sp.]
MLSGVYLLEFESEVLKGGLAIITAGKIHGGDPENIIAGFIHLNGDDVDGEVEVTNHTGTKPAAFAGNDVLTIKFQGSTTPSGFQAKGTCLENQALKIQIIAEKIRDIA